ncbi:MAG: hypothetical protein KAT05_00020 [Spirochaetes bacterium]|nr:hypothetical protein [Spirochaetota bacterium]
MTDKSTSKEYDEELVIGKITDLTSSVIGFVIVLLSFLKIKVPKTAENPIGIIILLISIYSTGGLLKIEFSIPMAILSFIIIIVFLEIVAYNKPKISQIFSKHVKAEKIINKIKDGTITPDEAYYEIFRFNFDADNIDKLIEDLSADGIFTSKIQQAIIHSQKLYLKNLKTYFGKNTNIRLDEKTVIDILNKPECYNSLSDEQIKTISNVYWNNDQIILTLLYSQQSAKNILKDIKQSVKLEYIAYNKYYTNQYQYWLDIYSNSIRNGIMSILVIIYVGVFIYISANIDLFKENLTDDVMGDMLVSFFSVIAFLIMTIQYVNTWIDRRIKSIVDSKRSQIIKNLKDNIAKNDASKIFDTLP